MCLSAKTKNNAELLKYAIFFMAALFLTTLKKCARKPLSHFLFWCFPRGLQDQLIDLLVEN